jgi:very-short-patch-repair endonuclease
VLDWADGSSQSGIETLVRARLRARGVRCRTQVRIVGVGRVDIVVGDRLIIETDGREHHDSAEAFSADRRRDLRAQARGYLVVRLSYRQVMFEWAETESLLLALIRRDEHLWRARHRGAASSG